MKPPVSSHPLARLLEPRGVAVVGASENPAKYGCLLLKTLIEEGYAGAIHPVNPNGGALLGRRFLASLDEASGPVDVALIVRPAQECVAAMKDVARRRVPFAIVYAAGFAERGEEGRRLERELVAAAAGGGTRVVGPNGMNIVSVPARLNLSAIVPFPPGRLGFLSASGNLGYALAHEASRRGGIGFSRFISVGNQADLALDEYLDFLCGDPETAVVLIYVEGFVRGRARRFLDALARTAARKPVLVLRGGRTRVGSGTARSHTGALASEPALARRALEQAGAVLLDRADEALAVAQALLESPLPRGGRTVLVGEGGGHATLLADAASEAAYVAARLGPSLLAWEIGNEPDLYRRHDYRPSSWNYDDYLEEWRALRDAMSQASPGVSFSGPATSFDLARFTLPFVRDEGATLAMLTHHYYRADRNDPDSTLALLLQPHLGLLTELSRLVPAAAAEDIAQGVRLAEANSFYNGGVPNVSNAYGTALWVMDFMFICALAGCIGVNIHGGGSGPGYTPIADRDGLVVEARPELYGMLMFAQAAQGLPMEGTVDADAVINVSAWGVGRDDGGLNAILINKDGSRSVSMGLATGTAATRFDPLWLNGTALPATTGHTLGGVTVGADGSWAPQPQEPMIASDGRLDVLLPPASAVLLRSL